ncbi:hypothetical protein ACI65C_009129 [Semiaphis heraclei]
MLKAATAEFEPKRLTYEHSGNVKTSNTVCITDNDYLQNDSDNYLDPNTIEFLIDGDNMTDSNAILNTDIPSETVHHTEWSSNIIQPPIVVVVPQLEVANAPTVNMEKLFLDHEYSENIEIVNGGRKKAAAAICAAFPAAARIRGTGLDGETPDELTAAADSACSDAQHVSRGGDDRVPTGKKSAEVMSRRTPPPTNG